ncbi:hypothetical protein GOBAR_AA20765 [Gossypium barbadense]|uniref:Uncharacterized protein n=1 Tax=Gossypium barbadense TaxID=3634 RepID=A0A2P5X999_GOSBA|nr:hypothetical protein GOBAR_AA20765 [Gossypium barbadense]
MAFLGNIKLVLKLNTCPPIKINGQGNQRPMLRCRKASHVISLLHCRKYKLPFLYFLRQLKNMAMRRRYLDVQLVRIRQ